MTATKCKSCNAHITWARTEKGKRMPIDLERREDGRIVLVHDLVREPPLVKVLTDEELEQERRHHAYRVKQGMEEDGPFRLFVSHSATCPDAGRHRRRPGGGRRPATTTRNPKRKEAHHE
jgi:hypothetical protein